MSVFFKLFRKNTAPPPYCDRVNQGLYFFLFRLGLGSIMAVFKLVCIVGSLGMNRDFQWATHTQLDSSQAISMYHLHKQIINRIMGIKKFQSQILCNKFNF